MLNLVQPQSRDLEICLELLQSIYRRTSDLMISNASNDKLALSMREEIKPEVEKSSSTAHLALANILPVLIFTLAIFSKKSSP